MTIYWFDHSLYQDEPVSLHPADRGLMLGDGVFDTALVASGKIVNRAAHSARLIDHAARIGINITQDFINQAIDALIEAGRDGILRLTITRGHGPRGIAPPANSTPTLIGSLSPLDTSIFFKPVRLWQTGIRRNETSPQSQIKSINYLDAILAQRDAQDAGYDEALFLNTRHTISCTSTANIFAVTNGHIKTPPCTDGVMNGTIRQWLLDQGLGITEKSMTLGELLAADAVFITNSRRQIAPVSTLNSSMGTQHYPVDLPPWLYKKMLIWLRQEGVSVP